MTGSITIKWNLLVRIPGRSRKVVSHGSGLSRQISLYSHWKYIAVLVMAVKKVILLLVFVSWPTRSTVVPPSLCYIQKVSHSLFLYLSF